MMLARVLSTPFADTFLSSQRAFHEPPFRLLRPKYQHRLPDLSIMGGYTNIDSQCLMPPVWPQGYPLSTSDGARRQRDI